MMARDVGDSEGPIIAKEIEVADSQREDDNRREGCRQQKRVSREMDGEEDG